MEVRRFVNYSRFELNNRWADELTSWRAMRRRRGGGRAEKTTRGLYKGIKPKRNASAARKRGTVTEALTESLHARVCFGSLKNRKRVEHLFPAAGETRPLLKVWSHFRACYTEREQKLNGRGAHLPVRELMIIIFLLLLSILLVESYSSIRFRWVISFFRVSRLYPMWKFSDFFGTLLIWSV